MTEVLPTFQLNFKTASSAVTQIVAIGSELDHGQEGVI
jgi:hypothetical protein